ncbi:MAG: 2-oxo acid dehydrogenase subunit E2 [Lachnospiraceae bacterium]|nr:2-oxo acid dehydrogenase subunit E2 [Lachnospiraceae bacterium]
MISEVRMPQLGVTMEVGMVSEWYKQEGDPVKVGEALLSVETEKILSDVEAEADGILLHIIAHEDEEVPVQGLLGVIGAPGDVWSETGEGGVAAQTEREAPDGRVKSSPLARRTAAGLGVDIAQIPGSGTSGRVHEREELPYHQQQERTVPAGREGKEADYGDVRKRMSSARRIIAQRMTESLLTAPQVTLMREVNADRLLELRHEICSELPQDFRVSINDLLIRLLAVAVEREPALNVSVDGDELIYHRDINIGVAVALEDGLLVPVVKNANKKGIKAIAEETAELIGKARSGGLSPDELKGGTITISNLRSFGVDGFTPVINLPEAAIMGIGRIVKKPIVGEDGSLRAANMMTLSLTFDHRAADGAEASKLLEKFAKLIEKPGCALL